MNTRALFIILIAACLTGCGTTQTLDQAHSTEGYFNAGLRAEAAGSLRDAEKNYEKALASLYDQLEDDDEAMSQVLFRLGRVKSALCEWQQAEDYLKESLLMEEKASDFYSEATVKRTFEIAYFYFDREMYEPSLPYFAQGIQIAKDNGMTEKDPIALASIYDDYETSLRQAGQADDAQIIRDEAAAIRSRHPDRKAAYSPGRYSKTCINE